MIELLTSLVPSLNNCVALRTVSKYSPTQIVAWDAARYILDINVSAFIDFAVREHRREQKAGKAV